MTTDPFQDNNDNEFVDASRHEFTRSDWCALLFFLLVVPLTSLTYAIYTDHTWEDFFITYRCSENFANGHGLVFQRGERVHAYTSVINTILPAVFAIVTKSTSYQLPLWLYRIASIAALTGGGFMICRQLASLSWVPRLNLYFFALLFSFEIKTIAFTTNGQEAGFMILFLLPSVVAVYLGIAKRWWIAGICWAGLMYTRPDGFVYIAALIVASLFFTQRKMLMETLRGCLKAGSVCTVLYLPWFVFAWCYYGNPIPHTILAKSALSADITFRQLVEGVMTRLVLTSCAVFQPIASVSFSGWPSWVFFFALACGVFSAMYWVLPGTDRLGRICSFVFAAMVVYFAIINTRGPLFPWYLPPVAACGLVVLFVGPIRLARKWCPGAPNHIATAVNMACVAAFAVIFYHQTMQMRVQQLVIEQGHRREIGLWLKDNVQPNETVFLECLGYIGYFSNAHMLDFPGLASPSVRSAILNHRVRGMADIIPLVKPDWLVLREHEAQAAATNPWVAQNYVPVREFDASFELGRHAHIWGRPWLEYDAVFLVLRRRQPATQLPH